jgi:hypothetical protein
MDIEDIEVCSGCDQQFVFDELDGVKGDYWCKDCASDEDFITLNRKEYDLLIFAHRDLENHVEKLEEQINNLQGRRNSDHIAINNFLELCANSFKKDSKTVIDDMKFKALDYGFCLSCREYDCDCN